MRKVERIDDKNEKGSTWGENGLGVEGLKDCDILQKSRESTLETEEVK